MGLLHTEEHPMRPLPDTVRELLADLEENYPPRCKTLEESPEEHAQYAGQVELIATLRSRYDWTAKNHKIQDI